MNVVWSRITTVREAYARLATLNVMTCVKRQNVEYLCDMEVAVGIEG